MAKKFVPHDQLATEFMADPQKEYSLNLLLFGDTFFVYDDGVYTPLKKRDLCKEIYSWLRMRRLNEATEFTQDITPSTVEKLHGLMLLEVEHQVSTTKSDWLVFSNNMCLNLITREIVPAARNRVAFMRLPFDSTVMNPETKNPTPYFFRYLQTTFVKEDGVTPDPELQAFVQEMLGYLLIDSNAASSAFFLTGSGANGKSVFLDLLRAFFPDHLVSSSSLKELTTNRFRPASLVGKKVNIVNEEESRHVSSEFFKNLVSGEPITVERKFGDPFEIFPSTKLIFASNNLPTFDGVDQAIRRRVKIVPFNATFRAGDPNRILNLSDHLKRELPGIFCWALDGLQRLIQNGYVFTEAEAMKEAQGLLLRQQNSTLDFLEDLYEVTGDEGDMVPKPPVYQKYKDWCYEMGRKAKSSQMFWQDVANRFNEAGVTFSKNAVKLPDGNRARVVKGIKEKSL